MLRQIDRYFELLPLIALIIIMLAAEARQKHWFGPVAVETSLPAAVQVPRLILR
jgi:hypothetical protein